MSRKHPRIGVLFYAPTQAQHTTILSFSKSLQLKAAAKKQRDPLRIFLAKHIMNAPVITVDVDETISNVARFMEMQRIGSLVVVTEKGVPIGILTERDVVIKVLPNRQGKTTAKDVMSSPLITIEADVSVRETARVMNRMKVKRLGIIYKGDLVGIVSSTDILALLPIMTQILKEMPEWEL